MPNPTCTLMYKSMESKSVKRLIIPLRWVSGRLLFHQLKAPLFYQAVVRTSLANRYRSIKKDCQCRCLYYKVKSNGQKDQVKVRKTLFSDKLYHKCISFLYDGSFWFTNRWSNNYSPVQQGTPLVWHTRIVLQAFVGTYAKFQIRHRLSSHCQWGHQWRCYHRNCILHWILKRNITDHLFSCSEGKESVT